MKEFKHTVGGRFDYSEDIHNLQNYANALNSFFEDCGKQFVINGCQVNGQECSDGYVWLGGKIRYVPSATVELANNEVIYIEVYDQEGVLIDYGDGSKGQMNVNYGARYMHKKESEIEDPSEVLIYTENGFPDLNNTFFRHYSLTRNGEKQTFSTPVSLDYIHVDTYHDGSKYFAIYNGEYEMRLDYNGLSFYRSGVLIYRFYGTEFYRSGNKIFEIGSDNGEIDIPSMTSLQTLNVKNNIDVEDKISIDGDDIKTIFAYTNYPVDTGWLKLVNSATNAEIDSLLVRQRKENVIIKGIIPKEYITSFNDGYVSIVDKQGQSVNDSNWVVYRLNIKLPTAITAPNSLRLPGCVLSSNYQSTDNLSCNNVELHVGVDNYLYVIGKPINMNWSASTFNGVSCTGPAIYFDYLID